MERAYLHTYFVYCPYCGQVKIGGSDDYCERLDRLESEHRYECRSAPPDPRDLRLTLLAIFRDNHQQMLHKPSC